MRIPQAMMGLYGFKPSVRSDSDLNRNICPDLSQSSRFPYEGVPVSTEGQEHVPSSVGPMARNLSSLIHMSRLMADSQPWTMDPKCSPLPWREDMFQSAQGRPLTIGLILDDGVVRVHPPIARALEELSAKLKAAGHELVTWDVSDHKTCIDIMDQYYTADGGEDIRRDVEAGGEPFIPHVEALVNRGSPISVYEYWQLNRKKHAMQKKFLDAWGAIDVLLAPTLAHVAVPHRSCRWIGYTKVWNVLDYPALTFPAGKVCREKDALPAEPYVPRNALDEWNWKLYDPDMMDGHPVNLQIIGRKLEEEKVLGAAVVIERVLQAA